MIANKVSSIGIARIISGIINDVIVTFLNPNKAITAIINPMKLEPQSPANIVAGLKLYTKNPKVDPNIVKASTKSNPVFPWIIAIIPTVK